MQYKWLGSETTFPHQFQPSYCCSVLCTHDWLFQVYWCSGLTSRLELWLGRGAECSIPRSTFVFCGEDVSVHSLCGRWCVHSIVWLHPVKQHHWRVQTVLEKWSKGSPWNHPFWKVKSTESLIFFFLFCYTCFVSTFINCGVVWYTAVFCICIRFFFY